MSLHYLYLFKYNSAKNTHLSFLFRESVIKSLYTPSYLFPQSINGRDKLQNDSYTHFIKYIIKNIS